MHRHTRVCGDHFQLPKAPAAVDIFMPANFPKKGGGELAQLSNLRLATTWKRENESAADTQ